MRSESAGKSYDELGRKAQEMLEEAKAKDGGAGGAAEAAAAGGAAAGAEGAAAAAAAPAAVKKGESGMGAGGKHAGRRRGGPCWLRRHLPAWPV